MTIDFSKAEIGLEINDPSLGNGVIIGIGSCPYDDDFQIQVKFNKDNITEYFTSDGRYSPECYPTLRVGHFPPLEQGEIPENKPKPLEFKGTPKMAYVSDSEDGFKGKVKRFVIAGNKVNGWVAMYYGDNTSTSTVINWNYAWEIEEDE